MDADIATNTYKLYYDGIDLHPTGGTFNFRVTGQTSLNGIRYSGPQALSAVPTTSSWGMSLDDVYVGTDVPPPPPDCDSTVSPPENPARTSFAIQGQPANPGAFVYTIGNNAGVSHNYTIQEVDAGGAPNDHSWLYLDDHLDTTTRTIGASATDTVTAAIDTTGLTAGTYTAYLRFTDDCSPTTDIRRAIQLTVKDCWWSITPGNVTIPQCPTSTQQVFTITNLGVVDIEYSVEKVVECLNLQGQPWLTLDKSGGVIPAGQSDTVTATISTADMPVGDSACDRLFLRDCDDLDPSSEVIRTVTLRTLTPFWLEYNGDVAPDAANSAGIGRTFVRQLGTAVLGGVADDPAAYDGKAWRIIDSDATTGVREFWRSDPTDNLDGRNGATMVARMKVLSETDSDAHLRISNNGGNSAGLHWGGPSGQVVETTRSRLASITGDGEYHIFRMSSLQNQSDLMTVKIYVDENPTPVLEFANGMGIGLTPDGFGFGVLGSASTADISFDWITATHAGAFGPGEEVACTGQSLVLEPPACVNPPTVTDISPRSGQQGDTLTNVVVTGTNFAVGQTAVKLTQGANTIQASAVNVTTAQSLTCTLDLTGAALGTWSVVVTTTGCPPSAPLADVFTVQPRCSHPPQDVDGDGDVDLADFSFFQLCFHGPKQTVSSGCAKADFDADRDVDLVDFGRFQACFNGPNRCAACP